MFTESLQLSNETSTFLHAQASYDYGKDPVTTYLDVKVRDIFIYII